MELNRTTDFETVKAIYLDVIENTPDMEKYARWVYGQHPTDETIRTYIYNGEMYLLTDGDAAVGVVAIVMHQDADYETVSWAEDLANDEVATLHLLAVCPAFRGKRLGETVLEEAAALAKKSGKKALRLDTLRSNLPAQKLYDKTGFFYRGVQHLYAENTGWTDFLYYEKSLR